MATFDWMAPPQTYWTPPKIASGSDKTQLALNGFNADGTKNLFGKVRAFLPFSTAMEQHGEDYARDHGLADVAENVQAGYGDSMAKSQIGLGVITGALGLATGNPSLALSGGQAALGGITSAAAMPKPQYTTGTTGVQYFKDGGRMQGPKPKSVAASESTRTVQPQVTWLARKDIADEASNYPYQQVAADSGADWLRNWVRGRAAASMAGLNPADSALANTVANPFVAVTAKGYEQLPEAAGSRGIFYDQYHGPGRAFVRPDLSTSESYSTSAHEAAHQLQMNMGDATANPHPAWAATNDRIRKAVLSSSKDMDDDYLTQPIEIHSRLMQIRQAAGLKAGEAVTPDRYKKAIHGMFNMGHGPLNQLRQVLDEHQIIDLLNKTVDNTDYSKPTDVLNAKHGGSLRNPALTNYADNDDTEDVVGFLKNPDGTLGREVVQFRMNETFFDQEASDTIDELTRSGNHLALGRFVAAERATHPDWAGSQDSVLMAKGGGRPGPKPSATLARQKELKAMGYYTGKLDGIAGPQTRAAESMAAMSAAAARPSAQTPAMADADVSLAPPSPAFNLTPPSADATASAIGLDSTDPVVSDKAPAVTAALGEAPARPDYLSYGLDAAKAITAAFGANQKLPVFNEDPAIIAERERLHRQLTEGMSSGEMQRLDNTLRQQSAGRSEALRGSLGGGGTQGALLAAQAANADADTAAAFAVTDANNQRKREAAAPYEASLAGKQAIDYNAYQTNYANTVNSRDAYAKSVGANLQRISDQRSYERLAPYTQKTLAALSQQQLDNAGSHTNPLTLLNLYANPNLSKYAR